MNKTKKIILICAISLVAVIALVIFLFFFSLRAVGDSEEVVDFVVISGEGKEEIVDNLKDAGLVRSKYATLIYIVLSGNTNIQAGNYAFNRGMSTQDIVASLASGDIIDSKRVSARITFKEGIRLEEYMRLLAENTNLEYEEIIEEVNSDEFLESLINDYWFLTDEVLNDDLYYGLEGYLYPETYDFYVDTTLDEAVRRILNHTDEVLSRVREEIDASGYSVHEILTMASIVEKEAINVSDRASVAQVIYTRLDMGMNLGMDVTTYYGVRKDLTDVLTTVDLNDENPYNTRVATFIGLPVGPICNPAITSVDAVLNPSDTNYVYFFADVITGNVYFTDNYDEFLEFIRIYG